MNENLYEGITLIYHVNVHFHNLYPLCIFIKLPFQNQCSLLPYQLNFIFVRNTAMTVLEAICISYKINYSGEWTGHEEVLYCSVSVHHW